MSDSISVHILVYLYWKLSYTTDWCIEGTSVEYPFIGIMRKLCWLTVGICEYCCWWETHVAPCNLADIENGVRDNQTAGTLQSYVRTSLSTILQPSNLLRNTHTLSSTFLSQYNNNCHYFTMCRLFRIVLLHWIRQLIYYNCGCPHHGWQRTITARRIVKISRCNAILTIIEVKSNNWRIVVISGISVNGRIA